MATHDSVQFAKLGSVTKSAEPIEANEAGGIVRVLHANHDNATATLAENDLVNLFKLPRGARPLQLHVTHGAFGAGVTMDIGWSGDEDALESAIDVAAAGVAFGWSNDLSKVTAEKTVQAKFEGGNPVDSVDFDIWLMYVLD